MNNSFFPDESPLERSWSPNEVVGQKNDWLDRIFGRWYKFTTPRRPAANASFAQREAYRRARLASTIAFFYLLLLVLALPTARTLSPTALFWYLFTVVTITGSLIVNRVGKTRLASIMLLFIFEAGMASTQLAYNPLSMTNLPTYDLFVVGELLAVSLLPVQSVFIIALLNSAFITITILYQPHTAEVALAIHKQGIGSLITIPVMIQIFVACVVALWVYTSFKANERANRAEMVMMLEHDLAEQNKIKEQEKHHLEESIRQLVQAHIDTMNGQVEGRIPYPPAKVLWPLVGVMNSLWVRLRHAQEIERSQQQLEQAISLYTELVQQAPQSFQQPLPLKRTGTSLDPLILAMNTWQESWYRINAAEPGHGQTRR